MPVTAANTHFVKADTVGLGHGVYLPILSVSSRSTAMALNGVLPGHEYVVLWSPAPRSGMYPTMSEYKSDSGGLAPNGGILMDLDYSVATYGLYIRKTNNWPMLYWADFDHWPLDDGGGLVAGMANGHYHPRADTSQQKPVNNRIREILVLTNFATGGI